MNRPRAEMHSSIVTSLDDQAAWRLELDRELQALQQFVATHELADGSIAGELGVLRERLRADKLVLAFVAEFSRGKSELINAIFFADTGRRVLPATPGRTTMCPVELRCDAGLAPRMSLLPVETRLQGLTLTELRTRDDPWQQVPLDPADPEALARALTAVTRTQRVDVERATALGLWNAEQPQDNPPVGADGLVEVPTWRHAVINYPHPLLQRGLVVIDTPGLNAVGAEPELTLSLLPSAHAIVFVLAADTGVTRTDLAMWHEHLAGRGVERFVVLNKIDTLADPLSSADEVAAMIERQRAAAGLALDLPAARVYPLSARDALAARIGGDPAALARSRLPALEDAITTELVPRQRELLARAAAATLQQLRAAALRRVLDSRRQNAEQMFELRGLRGKSGAKLRLMLQRIDGETAEFEQCTARIVALRAVQMRMLAALLASLSGTSLRSELAAMQAAIGASTFQLGARQAFSTLCSRLRQTLADAALQADEMQQMLDASLRRLNAEFGFAFAPVPAPELTGFADELALIEQNYGRYLTLPQLWRLALPGFMEQFRRMLASKLRLVFEGAACELERWSRAVAEPIDLQLRERRLGFARRRDALERVQAATGELEQRISEVEAQDAEIEHLRRQLERRIDGALACAEGRSVASAGPVPGLGRHAA